MRVVFVHGFLGSSLNWGPVINKLRPVLDAATELLAVDLLGHGARPKLEGPLNLASIAQDLLGQIPPGPFVGVGHSFGLRPLLQIATDHPGRVQAIVVEDSSPVLSSQGYDEIRSIFERIPVPFLTRDEARASLEQHFGDGSRMSRFLLAQIRERSDGHTWRFDLKGLREVLEEAHRKDMWAEWEAFAGPISMILGEVPLSFVSDQRLAECIARRAQRPTAAQRIPQSGHWVHADQPVAFVNSLGQILKNLQA